MLAGLALLLGCDPPLTKCEKRDEWLADTFDASEIALTTTGFRVQRSGPFATDRLAENGACTSCAQVCRLQDGVIDVLGCNGPYRIDDRFAGSPYPSGLEDNHGQWMIECHVRSEQCTAPRLGLE